MTFRAHGFRNWFHTVLLVGGMALLLGYLGYRMGGTIGLAVLAIIGAVSLAIGPRFGGPRVIMRMYRARPVQVSEGTDLYAIVERLAERAELSSPPRLYYIPSRTINAFAMGTRRHALIGLTDGLLRILNGPELVGVLAHEITHIRNNDILVMSVADLMTRVLHVFSQIGWLLLLLNLPVLCVGGSLVPWSVVLLLIAGPTIANLAQLALSRTREFEADRGAIELAGDASGLISALSKLEHAHTRLRHVLMPGRVLAQPSILRTHPHTRDRLTRLHAYLQEMTGDLVDAPDWRPHSLDPMVRSPRRHLRTGIWR